MPYVEFTTNLGSRDADALGLEYGKCTKGATLEVTADVADKLCSSQTLSQKTHGGSYARRVSGKKAELPEADLEKLTAPDTKKK